MKFLFSIPPEWLLITVIVLAFAIGCGIGWLMLVKKKKHGKIS